MDWRCVRTIGRVLKVVVVGVNIRLITKHIEDYKAIRRIGLLCSITVGSMGFNSMVS